MAEIQIGRKIQEYRKSKGLTIRDLAAQAGVTASLLSQLERDLANPSITTLKAIAGALDIPLYSFFIESAERGAEVVRAAERKKMIFPRSHDLAYELLTPDTAGTLEFLLMTLPPGACSSENPQGHEGEEVAYVRSGTVSLQVEEETLVLQEGDSVRILPFRRHRWVNGDASPAVVIFAITPPSF